MPESAPNSLDIVNSSGFPYQLRLQHEVEVQSEKHGWFVVASEFRWADSTTGSEGYADLVIERDETRLILECKKAKESTKWVFLVPVRSWQTEADLCSIRGCKLFWTHRQPPESDLEGWSERKVEPRSFRSAFCVIDRKSDQANYMLEKTCRDLLCSVEAVGRQELEVRDRHAMRPFRFYGAIIVTTAELEVCLFDPANIDLVSGTMPYGSDPAARFTPVDWVRFQKPLFSTLRPPMSENLQQANARDERTVFVVRGTSLVSFLKQWKEQVSGSIEPWETTGGVRAQTG